MEPNIQAASRCTDAISSAHRDIPFLLLVLSLIIWFSFQLFQTLNARENLTRAINTQEPLLKNGEKVQQSLTALATATKQLANQGNANATLVVNALAQRGVNIDLPKPQ